MLTAISRYGARVLPDTEQIVARCKRADIHLRPSDLFQHPTVAALAAVAGAAPPPQQAAAPAFDIHPELLDLALAQVQFDE